MLDIGSTAPHFAARNQDGKEIRLESYLGEKSVVLYFYPKNSTPG